MKLCRWLITFLASESDFRTVCDEGVRLGIGAAARCVTQLAEQNPTYDGQQALHEACEAIRQLSIDYGDTRDEGR